MYCDHCQTTAVEGARFCSSCGGKLSEGPAAAADAGSAPTVALTVGPCESCGAVSLPGSTLCLPCTRAFESILGTQPPTAVETAPMPAVAEMATLLVPQASALPSAPGAPAAPNAAAPSSGADDEDEYEDVEEDDLLGEEAATVLAVAPQAPPLPPPAPPAPEPAAAPEPASDWSTPSTTPDDHEAIVAVLPWARKGPEAAVEPTAVAEAEPGAEPTPWWERNGQQSPAAGARPETARYVPPPAGAPPPSSSLESSVARQAMRPKAQALPPVVSRRHSGSRSRTFAIAAAVAGVAAIGTPVAWKLAFASRPTVVSMPRPAAPAPAAQAPEAAPSRAPRPERTHGLPPAEPPRVYHDLQPQEPVAAVTIGKNGIPVASAAVRSNPPAAPRPTPAAKKPAARVTTAAPAPAPTAPPPAPTPAPLAVSAPPVAAVPVAAAPTPGAQVSPEAVPLGQIFEVSQVDKRPSVASNFDPVLPARLAGHSQVVLIVRVLVAPSGRAADASTVKNPTNDAGVAAAAVATVRQWKFTPAMRKGQAVSCWYNVGVVFKPASGN